MDDSLAANDFALSEPASSRCAGLDGLLTSLRTTPTYGIVIFLCANRRRRLGAVRKPGKTLDTEPDHYLVTFSHHSTDTAQRSGSVRWLFKSWFEQWGFEGASSHAGRTGFFTKAT